MFSCFSPLNDPKKFAVAPQIYSGRALVLKSRLGIISPIERATELVHSLTLETVPESVSKKSAYKTIF